MTDSPALLRRLTRFRGDYSRRAYSLDAGDIEIVLGMGKAYDELAEMYATMLKAYTKVRNERDLLARACEAAESLLSEESVAREADCYVTTQVFRAAMSEWRAGRAPGGSP